jgi:hypothetical protein
MSSPPVVSTPEDIYIERVLASAPPLDADDRRRLAEILRPIRRSLTQAAAS